LVNAHRWIGDDQSSGTFVQIGDKEHPKVTVIVKGTVWVRPPKESPTRSDGRESIINRLTLGDPVDPNVQAVLKIYCDTRGQHGIYVGYRSDKATIHRGSLHVYRSTITAAMQDPQHLWGTKDYTDEKSSPRWAAPGWYGSEIRLIQATISWFDGCPAYGMSTGTRESREGVEFMRPNKWHVIEETTFEHGGMVVQNGDQYLKDCVFRDLDVAIAEGGALGAKLVRCTFEKNRLNWTLGSLGSRGIVLLNCTVGRQEKPITITKNQTTLEEAMRQNVPIYPACHVRQSLAVKVVDQAGSPVPDATVLVTCTSDPTQVARGAAITNPEGMTGSDPEADAVVVTSKQYQATDDPKKPQETTYAHEVSVSKAGFQPNSVTLPAGRPIPTPLVVSLKKGE
jgi:hypothetical protein